MSVRSRLDAIEAAFSNSDLDHRCPDCHGPVRQSLHKRADPRDTIGGLCHTCRRLLDVDGVPFGQRLLLPIVDEDADTPTLTHTHAGGVRWAEDGEGITIDAPKVTILDTQLYDEALG